MTSQETSATITTATTTTSTSSTTNITSTTTGREAAISNVETEYLEINSKGAWPVLYQHIRNESSNYGYTTNESKKVSNKNLNRYRDVAPYDHTRIVLNRGSCDYINANLIKVDRAKRQYILTQGPLPNTAGHFWLMVWEQNSKAVLMLNKTIEKNQIKCHQYFPLDNLDPVMVFIDVGMKVEYVNRTERMDYTTRILRLTDLESNESREILHFHYITWPDFGVPESPTAFLRFLVDVRQSGGLDENVGPPVVHCSAGIGRSGTFCLVDTCLVLIEENGLNAVNVRNVLLEMRQSRMGLIQTPDQLRFSYAAIIEGAKHLPTHNANDEDNETLTNHYDVVNNISNSVTEDDDESPPLPPPRGESLTRSIIGRANTENDQTNGPPDKPLPLEPAANVESGAELVNSTCVSKQAHENSTDNINVADESTNDGENSVQPADSPSSSPEEKSKVRNRYKERNERMAAQIRKIKRRQQETEEWKKLKRSKSDSTESTETIEEEAESPI